MSVSPKSVDVPKLVKPGPGWSHVKVIGSMVYVSGQVAWDAEGSVIGVGSVAEQTEAVFRNLECALAAVGSSLDRLVKITTYVTQPQAAADVRAIRDRWLAGIAPASTLVVVAALVDPALLVEIEAIAAL